MLNEKSEKLDFSSMISEILRAWFWINWRNSQKASPPWPEPVSTKNSSENLAGVDEGNLIWEA